MIFRTNLIILLNIFDRCQKLLLWASIYGRTCSFLIAIILLQLFNIIMINLRIDVIGWMATVLFQLIQQLLIVFEELNALLLKLNIVVQCFNEWSIPSVTLSPICWNHFAFQGLLSRLVKVLIEIHLFWRLRNLNALLWIKFSFLLQHSLILF